MIVANRDAFEPPLIDCSKAGETVNVLPSSRMSGFQPVHESGQRTVGVWGQHKMPMVRHDAVRKYCHPDPRDGLLKKVLECLVVGSMIKKNGAFGCSIEDMEDEARLAFPFPSRHSGSAEATWMPYRCREGVLNK